jgi:hypothetical protein
MKIEDIRDKELTPGKEYAFFNEENKLVNLLVYYPTGFQKFGFAVGSVQAVQSRWPGFTVYPAGDILPPVWETRPDGAKEINYDNRKLHENQG